MVETKLYVCGAGLTTVQNKVVKYDVPFTWLTLLPNCLLLDATTQKILL